jgi:hypothetical protein
MNKVLQNTLIVAITLMLMSSNVIAKTQLQSLQVQMDEMMKKIDALEANNGTSSKYTHIKSKVPTLKFSGKHYIGFVNDGNQSNFETRRNYFQVKAYMNKHDYFRTTFDTHHDDTGDWKVRLKYSYLYLDSILPNTGVELGQVHRPWIDNEEHGGWNYRSISKVFVEDSKGAHLTNSADLGFNLKTKLKYFSSELGVFNGEGYHGDKNANEVSGEWRLTTHLLGGGTHKAKAKNQYLNISYFGQKKAKTGNLDWHGGHIVYNQKAFLISAQYIDVISSQEKFSDAGDGHSYNLEYRFIPKWNLIGRMDEFNKDLGTKYEREIVGFTYKYNKNVEFIVNSLVEKEDNKDITNAFMLTSEINW